MRDAIIFANDASARMREAKEGKSLDNAMLFSRVVLKPKKCWLGEKVEAILPKIARKDRSSYTATSR